MPALGVPTPAFSGVVGIAGSNGTLMFFVYIIFSPSIDQFYIGKTSNFEQRLKQHCSGESTYTKRAGDWIPACCIAIETASEADLLERKIKKSKSRKTILRWIRGSNNLIQNFKI